MIQRYGARLLAGAMTAMTLAALLALPQRVSAQELIVNGSFENGGGSFAGWTVADQAGGAGSWFIQSGTSSPLNAFAVPAPPDGSFAAMTDQGGPGSHVLYQDVFVPLGVTSATLSFQYYLNSQSGGFTIGPGLDALTDPNQQARVDFITTVADPFSTAGGDVLQNIYQTNPGDPAVAGYFSSSTDITALLQANAGQTIRLRFAEVDNQLFFNNGVDQVSLQVTIGGGSAAPEPGTLALLLAGAGAIGIVRRRRAP